MPTLLLLYVISGLVLVIISIPMILGKIKPNLFYGFRVQATLEDPEIWYAVNRYFSKFLLITGLGVMVGSIALYFIPGISVDAYALACLGIFLAFFIPAMTLSWKYMNSLKK